MHTRTTTLTLLLGLLLTVSAPGQVPEALNVDTSRAAIELDEVLSGGPPPQGIPALGFPGDALAGIPPTQAPAFIGQDEAAQWLEEKEPVVALELGGTARAYPLQILTWHEIVNDELGGVPVAVTYCPLCNTAYVFDRRVPAGPAARQRARTYNVGAETVALPDSVREAWSWQTGMSAPDSAVTAAFGTSGALYNSNLLMFDTATHTLWAQAVGKGVVGTLTGARLLRWPAQLVSFAGFRETWPGGQVLSRETGIDRDYGRNPYAGYDTRAEPYRLFKGPRDDRLDMMDRVVTVLLSGEAVAWPYEVLEEKRVAGAEVAGSALAVFWAPGKRSAMDAGEIARGRDVGTAGVFRRELDGRTLTFRWTGEAIVDEQTDSRWTVTGRAVAGPLEGRQLRPVPHDNTFWFAWAAFKPDTRIIGL